MLVNATRRALPFQARLYAQNSNAKKNAVKAPVSVRGKAGQFAMKFFETAYEREGDAGVVRLEKELAVLDWSVRDQTSWRVQTTSPFFDIKWKREQITKRLTSQGLSPLLVDVVMELVTEGEIRRLQQVRVDYDEIMRAYRKEVDVTLTTATPLSAERLALFKRSIQGDYLKADDNLIFAHAVDDSIVGGYKVFIKGQEYDHSWASAVRSTEEHAASKASASRDSLSKAPRAVAVSGDDALKTALADKESLLPADVFSRAAAQDAQRSKKAASADLAKLQAALRAKKSASA